MKKNTKKINIESKNPKEKQIKHNKVPENEFRELCYSSDIAENSLFDRPEPL